MNIVWGPKGSRSGFRLLAALLAFVAWPVTAHEFDVGDMKIKHPYTIEPKATGAPVDVAVYMTIVTRTTADRLIGSRSTFAKRAEIVRADGRVSTSGIDLPQNAETIVGPKSAFIVLREVTEPLAGYQYFPMTLTFEKAGNVEIEVYVDDASKTSDGAIKN